MDNKEFLNYFMHPQEIIGIGSVYPIKVKDYTEFSKLASKYLLAGRKWLTNICKYPKDKYVLDFFIQNALIYRNMIVAMNGMNNEEQMQIMDDNDIIKYDILEIADMMSLTLKEEVTFELLGIDDNGVIDYRFKIGSSDNYITKFNFDIYRDMVMDQNLLFEPLTSPNTKGNEVIQNAIKVLSKTGTEMNIISVCSAVSVYKGVSDLELQEYTYFRLLYDFETINRLNNNIMSAIFLSQGSKESQITYLGERVCLNKNPYDNLLRRNGDNQLTKRLQQGS